MGGKVNRVVRFQIGASGAGIGTRRLVQLQQWNVAADHGTGQRHLKPTTNGDVSLVTSFLKTKENKSKRTLEKRNELMWDKQKKAENISVWKTKNGLRRVLYFIMKESVFFLVRSDDGRFRFGRWRIGSMVVQFLFQLSDALFVIHQLVPGRHFRQAGREQRALETLLRPARSGQWRGGK